MRDGNMVRNKEDFEAGWILVVASHGRQGTQGTALDLGPGEIKYYQEIRLDGGNHGLLSGM